MSDLLKRRTGIKVDARELSPQADLSERRFRAESEAVIGMLLEDEPELLLEDVYVEFDTEDAAPPRPRKDGWLKAVRILGAFLLFLFAAAAGTVAWGYFSGYRIGEFRDGGVLTGRGLVRLDQPASDFYQLSEYDRVTETEGRLVKTFDVERGATYFLIADGATVSVSGPGSGMRVSRLLEAAGVALGEDDTVSRAMAYTLSPGESVRVSRIRYEELTATEVIPYRGVPKPSPLLRAGRTISIYPAEPRDGKREVTYREKYVDGVLVQREELEVKILRQPVDYVVLTGANVPMSDLNAALYTDVQIVDGVPASYEKKLSGFATAYNFKGNVYGAGGMYLHQGMIATDPKVIPFGTLVYITSSDGSFVYGWAICADACDAAMEGRVLVDLYFDTYRETLMFGKHTMDVYVIGRLNQEQLAQYRANSMFDTRIPKA